MPFHLTDEQEIVRASLRQFAETEVKPLAAQLDREHRPPLETIPKLADLGVLGMTIPPPYGGSGTDYLSFVLALEELARVCATTAVMVEVHASLVATSILRFGDQAQKTHYLPELAAGRLIGAFALTEPGAGSDAAALTTRAEADPDGFVLNGQKIFITNGGFAGVFVVLARTSPAVGPKSISAFLVDRDRPGLSVGEPERKMGIRGSSTVSLLFDDLKLPRSALLGQLGQGFAIAMSGLDGGRTGIAAQALGIAQGAYEEAVAYAKQRVQFGQPIARLQAIQWLVADMATEIEAGRCLVYQAADRQDRGLPFSDAAAKAKLFCGPMATRVTHSALQILGGNGYTEAYPVERMCRDARITEIYEGTNEIQRLVIARSALR
ncbi:MAG: acyl-CoA dehydrogenase family protein [Propionibacteriaceae bacterium]|jgi:alkylation response protein AidB-like acyl-CoA dehydrogenase|nr:acyl-CoA dehydrogenase family protein [Propionibacteriaceae bacterium]